MQNMDLLIFKFEAAGSSFGGRSFRPQRHHQTATTTNLCVPLLEPLVPFEEFFVIVSFIAFFFDFFPDILHFGPCKTAQPVIVDMQAPMFLSKLSHLFSTSVLTLSLQSCTPFVQSKMPTARERLVKQLH
jgi:hypothetical protein